MQLEMIRSLSGYDRWATERILTCAESISAEQFVQADSTPWGSIRNQLFHLLTVQRGWMTWVDGSMSAEDAYQLGRDQSPEDFPGVQSIRDLWTEVHGQTVAYLDRATEDELQRHLTAQWPDSEFSIPVWQVLLHLSKHSMQHRTEIAMSLTSLGQSPGDLDYLFYALEANSKVGT